LVIVSALLGGCGSPVPLIAQRSVSPSFIEATASPAASSAATASVAAPATASPAPSLDRVAGWRADIDGLLAARESLHPDPWHGMARADWVAAADAVKARIPELTDDQALVELVRLAAMPSWKGRDGHSGIFLTPGSGVHPYPIRTWQFSDGLVITAARTPHEDLVGSRVTAIGGHPIDEVLRLVEPLSPRDNPSSLLAFAPRYAGVSELLDGLGVINHAGPAVFSLVGRDGKARDETIEPITVEEDVAWHGGQPLRLPPTDATWLRDQAKPLWWTYLDDSRTLFVQYNSVESGINGIADEILTRAKQDDVSRVVVDLRHNGGGDNTTMGHFEDVLRDPAINRPGRLVVLIGRITFSAAANFATDLEQTSAVTFAGEATGGSPNLYGDAREVALPYGGQSVYVATRYWQRSTADDRRNTIEPEIGATLSSADYFAGRDPVLQAVFDTPVAPG
jgi:Peptidase family S41